ncbi:MAG: serine/threonine protein kinase [Planctomycetes bacterium]|nr:serine/threonine protein kinase [Planctomycetota bacterium]
MTAERKCPKCGAQLFPDAPEGLCPKCLLEQSTDPTNIISRGAEAQEEQSSPGFTPPLPEELSELFPQLEILDMLGKGGMGAVYKARQTSLDRLVALKVLPLDVAKDPTFAERFSREAKALAKLGHPNIVMVHDFGQAGKFYYFLMEFVDGVNLRQAIKTQHIQPKVALKIVTQICDALQFAHEEGVVHRDIKPENILLDKKGNVKIADFGLAKLVGPSRADFTLTSTGQIMGTPHYMAPEQMEKPLEVDQRADIYSLGVVFYEMLTGELPLGRFAPPSQKVQVDVRIDEVVLRSLEREPARRYQNVSEVKTQVDTIAHSAEETPHRALRRPGRAHKILVTGVLALIAIAAAVFGAAVILSMVTGRVILRDGGETIQFGPDGPVVSVELAQTLDLRPMEEREVNKAIQEAYKKYLPLEAKHADVSRGKKGYVHVKVSPFSAELKAIQNRLWSKVDAVLDERQRAVARRHLPLRELFPYGDMTANIEMWHKGLQYHWKEEAKGRLSSSSSSGSSTDLQGQYKRFWEAAQKMEGTDEATAVEKVKKAFRNVAVKLARDICKQRGGKVNPEVVADQIMLEHRVDLAVTEKQAEDILAGMLDDAGNRAKVMSATEKFGKPGAGLPLVCAHIIQNVTSDKVTSGIELEFYARVIAGELERLKAEEPKSNP